MSVVIIDVSGDGETTVIKDEEVKGDQPTKLDKRLDLQLVEVEPPPATEKDAEGLFHLLY